MEGTKLLLTSKNSVEALKGVLGSKVAWPKKGRKQRQRSMTKNAGAWEDVNFLRISYFSVKFLAPYNCCKHDLF